MVFLTCPHLLSLGFLLILPCRSSPLSIHHPFWKETMHQNRILFQMMAQPLAIPFFLPCQCSHLLIFHVMVPHPSSPLSIRQFPNLSIHHQVPPEMNPIHLPCRFSLLHIIHIFPHRLSLLRIIHINLPLPSSPPFIHRKMTQIIHRCQIAILHQLTLPPLLVTHIPSGIISQKFDHSIHHHV